MDINKGLIFTSNNCIGCNKCIKGCPVIGANIAVIDNGNARIVVDDSKCIRCGKCLKNCDHGARYFKDDFDDLLTALNSGKDIDLLIAPSFFLVYKENAEKLIGYFKNLGFCNIYNVSFGANLTSWAYASYMKNGGKEGLISSSCPVIVSYIEKYKPELINYLMPIMSPVGCLKTYLEKKNPSDTKEYAFLCPCVGKQDEVSSYKGGSKLDYVFTFTKLNRYLENNNIDISHYYGKCNDLSDYALGEFYPLPGGLRSSIEMFYDSDKYIKQIEGQQNVYSYLDHYSRLVKKSDVELPLYIDVLNCDGGCVEGVANDNTEKHYDSYYMKLAKTRSAYLSEKTNPLILSHSSSEQRYDKFNRLMKKEGIAYTDFLRSFNVHASTYEGNVPSEVLESTFKKLHKLTPESRTINCQSCGYSSCHDMACAIAHGYNRPENCIHYSKTALEKERTDLINLATSIYKNGNVFKPEKMESEYILQVISQAFNDIEKAREEVLNESQSKNRFFASMTHELRTPLHAIINMAENVKKDTKDSSISKDLDSIISSGNNLLETINELLDMSKIDSGKFNIVEKEYELLPMLYDVCNIIRFRALEKKLDFDMVTMPNLPAKLIGDEKRIHQILINLLSNAVKYTRSGGVTLNVFWNNDKENPVLTFTVMDTGIGIKKEDIPFLFTAYQQVDEAKNHNIEGTGLGLSIVKALTDEMNGEVSVTSEYEQGSVFTVTLPQKIEKYEPIPVEENEAVEDMSSVVFPHSRILVVDDMTVNLKIAAEFLDNYQCQTTLASSADEALNSCKEKLFDIILMDFQMPEKSGIDALKELRNSDSINKDTPAIILSAEDSFENNDHTLFQAFVEKPLNKKQLDDALKKYISSDKHVKVENDVIPPRGRLSELVINKDFEEYLSTVCAIERIAKKYNDVQTARFGKFHRMSAQSGMFDMLTIEKTEEFDGVLDSLREQIENSATE